MTEFKTYKYLVELINEDKRIVTATGYKYGDGMICFFNENNFEREIVIEFSMHNVVSVAYIEL